MDFAVPAAHRVKVKENEKRDKYLDLARERSRPLNMRVAVISIIIGTLGTVHKSLERELEESEIGGRSGPSKLQHGWDRQ